MTKKSTESDALPDGPADTPTDTALYAAELNASDPEAYPLDADGNPPPGAMLPGWRSPLDNPAHPLHHLRNA